MAMKQPIEGNLTQRSVWWAMEFTKLLAEDAKLRCQIPNGALVFIPAEDPKVGEYKLPRGVRATTRPI
jgi:hypothetical protein